MKRSHFEALSPICPRCLLNLDQTVPLTLSLVIHESGDTVNQGLLQCTHADCLHEFPIIDGIPIIVPDVQAYLAESFFHITQRDDLSGELENLLGEGCGPGSHYDASRTHLSSYAWDHYGSLDPAPPPAAAAPGSVVQAMDRGLSMIPREPGRCPHPGPVMDVGCSVGRSTFELTTRADGLALGVDLNFSMLRLAQRVLTQGVARYPLRRVGLVYDQREFPVPIEHADRVDFWACDATLLPFKKETFALSVAMNVLDCVPSPIEMLRSLRNVLAPGGWLVLTTPYDWSSNATALEGWIGGHSPRAAGGGQGPPILEALLTPHAHPASIDGLQLAAQQHDIPWHVRMHDRSTVAYQLHLAVAQRQ